MNKRKKEILFIVVAVVLMVLFTACGGEQNKADDNNYVEKQIKLPAQADQVMDITVLEGGALGVIAMDKKETEGILWKSTDQGKQWTKQSVFTEKLPLKEWKKTDYTLHGYLSPSGDVFVSCTRFIKEDKTELACYYVTKGGSAKQMSVLEKEGNISQVDFTEEGTLLIETDGRIKRVDLTTGKPDVEYDVQAGQINAFTVFEDNLYVFDNNKVLGFDLKSGKAITVDEQLSAAAARIDNSKNFEGGGQKIVLYRDDSDQIVLDCMDKYGITSYTKSGALLLIDSQETCMYNQGGTVYALVRKDEKTLLAAASSDDVSSLYQYTDTPDKVKEKTTISFYTLEENPVFDKILGTFVRNNPSVRVKTITGIEENSGVTVSDALKTLNADILAGEGPDVICMDGIDVDHFIDNGLLADISSEIKEADRSEGLFTNVAKSYMRDGKTFAIPTQFGLMGISGHKKVIKNTAELPQLVDAIAGLGKGRSTMSEENFVTAAVILYQNYLMPQVTKEGMKDESLKGFYHQINRLYQLYGSEEALGEEELALKNAATDPKGYPQPYNMIEDKTSVQIGYWNELATFRVLKLLKDSYQMGSAQFCREKAGVFVPKNIISINGKSDNQQIAKELVSFMLTKKAQDNYYTPGFYSPVFSINKSVITEQLKECDQEFAVYLEEGSEVKGPKMNKKDRAEVIKTLENASVSASTDNILLQIVMSHLDAYLRGELTLDQASSAAMKKIRLYLAE